LTGKKSLIGVRLIGGCFVSRVAGETDLLQVLWGIAASLLCPQTHPAAPFCFFDVIHLLPLNTLASGFYMSTRNKLPFFL
jgi:hypothetical protein